MDRWTRKFNGPVNRFHRCIYIHVCAFIKSVVERKDIHKSNTCQEHSLLFQLLRINGRVDSNPFPESSILTSKHIENSIQRYFASRLYWNTVHRVNDRSVTPNCSLRSKSYILLYIMPSFRILRNLYAFPDEMWLNSHPFFRLRYYFRIAADKFMFCAKNCALEN